MRSTSVAAPRRACACRSGGGGGGGDSGGDGGAARARRTARPTRVATSTTSRTTHREKYGFDWTATATAEQRANASERERRANSTAMRESDTADGGEDDVEERWTYAHENESFEYRGAWLDLVSRQRLGDASASTSSPYLGSGTVEDFQDKVKKMRRKATKRRNRGGMSTEGFVMGAPEYEAALGELVEAHVRLARRLSLWRANFVLRFEREPEYADMPVSIRNIELDWISIGFKIRSIEK